MDKEVTRAYLLADPSCAALPVSSDDDGVMVKGPAQAPDAIDTVIVLTVEG
jgi:hypothetical protein